MSAQGPARGADRRRLVTNVDVAQPHGTENAASDDRTAAIMVPRKDIEGDLRRKRRRERCELGPFEIVHVVGRMTQIAGDDESTHGELARECSEPLVTRAKTLSQTR